MQGRGNLSKYPKLLLFPSHKESAQAKQTSHLYCLRVDVVVGSSDLSLPELAVGGDDFAREVTEEDEH